MQKSLYQATDRSLNASKVDLKKNAQAESFQQTQDLLFKVKLKISQKKQYTFTKMSPRAAIYSSIKSRRGSLEDHSQVEEVFPTTRPKFSVVG